MLAAALAARARVAMHEDAQHGGLHVQRRARDLRQVWMSADDMGRSAVYADWIQGNFLFSLEAAIDAVRQREHELSTTSSLLRPGQASSQGRAGWQARASKVLHQSTEAEARVHIRKRLDRWQLTILPGHRVERWLKVVQGTSKMLPPRIIASQFRVAFNGWITRRRMQQPGRCILGCDDCDDSIEHYALCKVYHRLCKRWLGLDRPTMADCLAYFTGIAMEGDDWSKAAIRAISVYALYRTHNAQRHSAARLCAEQLFRGFLREAVRGHPKAMSLLTAAFKRPRHDD